MHMNHLYIVALYVDDSFLVGKQGDFILSFKVALAKGFEIEDLGPACWLLGCKKIIRFGQEQDVTDILNDFDMSSATLVGTPMAAKPTLDPNSDQPQDKQAFPSPLSSGNSCTALIVPALTSRLMLIISIDTWRVPQFRIGHMLSEF